MPKVKEREYRNLLQPLEAKAADALNKRFDTPFYVEGYATTFDAPYLLYEDDEIKLYEVIDRNALAGADVSDVIMQFDHEGRVYARQSNNTLLIEPDAHGIFIAADLSRTAGAKELHGDIMAGMITKMSWAFTIATGGDVLEQQDEKTYIRRISKIKKVYDVSAVSLPANNDTEIAARSYAKGITLQREREQLTKRAALLKLKTML